MRSSRADNTLLNYTVPIFISWPAAAGDKLDSHLVNEEAVCFYAPTVTDQTDDYVVHVGNNIPKNV